MPEAWLQRIFLPEKSGGVPAKYIGKTIEFAEKCLRETPQYDEERFKIDRRKEIERVLNTDFNKENNK